MKSDTLLLFYGDSIFLAGVKAELATAVINGRSLYIITLSTETPDPLECIHDCRPQVILFDLSAPTQPDFVIPLLRQQPDLLLIGLDPSRDDLLVLSSQSQQAAQIDDLITLIRHQITIA